MPFDDTRKEGGGGNSNNGDIAAVLFFLRGAAEAGLMFNSRHGRDAFDAFARLFGQDPDLLWVQTGKVR